MSAMSELDADRQQIARLTDVINPPSFAASAHAGSRNVSGSESPFQKGQVLSNENKIETERRARIARLEADLLECREFLEGYVDVVDGDYGEPSPNRAMKLVSMIDETLNGSRT